MNEYIKDPIVRDPVRSESRFEKRFSTVLLSISTALILVTVNFLWNLKGDIATIQERDLEWSNNVARMQQSMNTMELDIQTLKERATRMEVLQSQMESRQTK